MTKDEFKDIAYHILVSAPRNTPRYELEIDWEVFWINQCIEEYERLKQEEVWDEYVVNWFEDLYDTLCKKNSDYSAWDDAFSNFYLCRTLGVGVDEWIKVRLCDKVSRIRNLKTKEPSVVWESLADAYLDCSWYLTILYIWYYGANFIPKKM